MRIDTLKFAKRLTEAGLTPAAAEAIVEGLNDADFSELATRSDVAETRSEIAELRADVASFKAETKAEFADVRAELAAFRAAVNGEFTGVRGEFAAVRGELRTEVATLRADIYSRLWAMGLGIVGLTVALIKLLPG